MQKAIIVYCQWEWPSEIKTGEMETSDNLEELNQLFEQGWKVVSCTPMGGAGDTSVGSALVILEK